MWYGICFIFVGGLVSALVILARQDGKKAERLSALKKEIQERANAQSTIDNVRNMSIDIVREKLQNTK